jgi:hypothetical protein
MKNTLNLTGLDDEEITVTSDWLNKHQLKIHKEFLDKFAINSMDEHSNEAMQIVEAIQELEMCIIYYGIFEKNKEFINEWACTLNSGSFHFHLERAIKKEKINRLANVLDKRLCIKPSSIDKKNKI